MTTRLARVIMFLSSYSPLGILIGILTFDQDTRAAISIIALSLLLFLFVPLYLRWMKQSGSSLYTIDERKSLDGDVLAYIATYLIPFITIPIKTIAEGIAVMFLMIVLCIIYTSSNMLYVNPVFSLFGYHIYEVSFNNNKGTYIVIARQRDLYNESVDLVPLVGASIFLAKDATHNEDTPN
jgi:hypothetical protein